MQASLTATKPFVAATAATRAPRAAGRTLAPVRAAAGEEAELVVPRRALAGLLAAAPVLLPASRALALIPDDDDEELVERARANRAQRLATERQTQQAFARSSKNLGACGGVGAWRPPPVVPHSDAHLQPCHARPLFRLRAFWLRAGNPSVPDALRCLLPTLLLPGLWARMGCPGLPPVPPALAGCCSLKPAPAAPPLLVPEKLVPTRTPLHSHPCRPGA